MKSFLAILACAACAFADDPPKEPPVPARDPHPWKVHVELQVISLPEKAALTLLPALRDAAKIEGARKELAALLTTGEARMVAAPIGAADDLGTIATSQTEEVRYPIEFESPKIVTADGKKGAAKPGEAIVTIEPSTFESRAVGVSLTVGADVGADGQALTLDTTAEHVWHLGWAEFEAGADLRGEKLRIRQPKFATAKTAGRITLRSGEATLLSIHKDRAAEGRMELFIFRAWTTPLQKK